MNQRMEGSGQFAKTSVKGRPDQIMEIIINDLMRTNSNDEFIDLMMEHFAIVEKEGYNERNDRYDRHNYSNYR